MKGNLLRDRTGSVPAESGSVAPRSALPSLSPSLGPLSRLLAPLFPTEVDRSLKLTLEMNPSGRRNKTGAEEKRMLQLYP